MCGGLLLALTACGVVGEAGTGAAQVQAEGSNAQAVTILQMPGNIGWRYFETWQTDVARLGDPGQGGKLVRVEPRWGFDPKYNDPNYKSGAPVTTEKIVGSPFPPDDWRNAEFDDSGWLRC